MLLLLWCAYNNARNDTDKTPAPMTNSASVGAEALPLDDSYDDIQHKPVGLHHIYR